MAGQRETNLRPPIDYSLEGDDKKLTVNWKNYFNSLWLFFNYSYQGNIPVDPPYTNMARDAIDNPQNGMRIYNTDLDEFQGYKAGSWVTFTTS